ncbi:MAG: PEP-CTERM sorting domain-containing protein, partial [Pirellulales bacterium]
NDSITLPASGPFIVTSNLSLLQGKLLQVGFSMDGINGNPVNAGSNGSVSVSVVPEPSSVAMMAAAGVGLVVAGWSRRRKS